MPGILYDHTPTARLFWSYTRPLLDWLQDALLAEHFPTDAGACLDLRHVLVVVPTSTARRRILTMLTLAAKDNGLLPPVIWTPGEVMEESLPMESQVATEVEMRLAWARVLETANLDHCTHLFPVKPPQQGFDWALRLAEVFIKLAKEVAEVSLDLRTVAAKLGQEHSDAARWAELATLENSYYLELSKVRLKDAHDVKRRLLKDARLPKGIAKVFVVGLSDPPIATLDVLQNWVLHGLSVTTATWAEPEDAAAFDSWGRPIADVWSTRSIPFSNMPEQVKVLTDASEQAEHMVEWLLQQQDRGALGITDAELQPPLLFELERYGLGGFVPEGQPLRGHVLSWMLQLVAEIRQNHGWESFCKLLRIPSVLDWVEKDVRQQLGIPEKDSVKLLRACDAFQAARLPVSIGAAKELAQHSINTLKQEADEHDQARKVHAAVTTVERLFRVLEIRPLREAVSHILHQLCSAVRLVPASVEERAFHQAESAILEALQRCERAVGLFYKGLGDSVHLHLLLRELEVINLFPDHPSPGEFILQGWLELLWEPNPVLVVGGMNEGKVPESIIGDLWLPHQQRVFLGMRTNEDRFARDAYILQSLLASRSDGRGSIRLCLGQSGKDGGLKPSRLLVRCEKEELPSRIAHLFSDHTLGRISKPPPVPSVQWKLRVPKPSQDSLDLKKISVTTFRDYLACPFRYYLKHQLRMSAYDVDMDEPDGRAFGNLCHDVLMAMAKDKKINASTDSQQISQYLKHGVDDMVRATYGKELSLPLVIHREAARNRLAAAADIHAKSRSEGWMVWKVEEDIEEILGSPWKLKDTVIRGRIDLIERNTKSKQWRIIDYKTSNKASKPEAAHMRSARTLAEADLWKLAQGTLEKSDQQWQDLQLPLYVLALKHHPDLKDYEPGAAYISLPTAASDTALQTWEGIASPTLLASAQSCASEVIERIRSCQFWPPAANIKYDDYKDILLSKPLDTVDPTDLLAKEEVFALS